MRVDGVGRTSHVGSSEPHGENNPGAEQQRETHALTTRNSPRSAESGDGRRQHEHVHRHTHVYQHTAHHEQTRQWSTGSG